MGLLWKFVLHLPDFLRLFARLLADNRVPLIAKLAFLLPVAYLIIPLDFDFYPLVGYLDDLVLLWVGCWLFIRLSPPDVVREHVERIGRGE